jgi:hypothetical protein
MVETALVSNPIVFLYVNEKRTRYEISEGK